MAEVPLDQIINGSKIPDPIKLLPTFSGDSSTLHHWINTVQGVMDLFEGVREQNPLIHNMWMGVFRTKVIGKANDALVMRNIPNRWDEIRAALIDIFGDRRDLSTLTQKIPYLSQGNKTLDDFYKEVIQLTADMNQKIALDARYADVANGIATAMTLIHDLTRNAFIDGLNQPFNLTVRGSRPQTIEEAKSAADEQMQSYYRGRPFSGNSNANSSKAAAFFQNTSRGPNQRNPRNFSRPSNQQVQQNPQQSQQPQQFLQQPQNLQQQFQTQNNVPRKMFNQGNYQHNYQAGNPRQSQNNAPMEVDPSTRSRQSVQPMSISTRTFNHLNNTEYQTENELECFNENNNEAEELFDEANFHLEEAGNLTG